VPARPHVLARASDVPPGTGLVVDGPAGIGPVVLAQPQPGTVKAFAAVCTHEPTPLGPPGGGSITCPRCGSQYVPATGAVSHGPATRPLRQIAVLVQDGTVLIT
jgi:nitrite reductase/ring-hydroxylating ferredoxin subunit